MFSNGLFDESALGLSEQSQLKEPSFTGQQASLKVRHGGGGGRRRSGRSPPPLPLMYLATTWPERHSVINWSFLHSPIRA